jgi:hypothetical protein
MMIVLNNFGLYCAGERLSASISQGDDYGNEKSSNEEIRSQEIRSQEGSGEEDSSEEGSR